MAKWKIGSRVSVWQAGDSGQEIGEAVLRAVGLVQSALRTWEPWVIIGFVPKYRKSCGYKDFMISISKALLICSLCNKLP
jgi:hypothetical protein